MVFRALTWRLRPLRAAGPGEEPIKEVQQERKNTTIKDLPLQPGGKPERRRRKEEREGERGRRD